MYIVVFREVTKTNRREEHCPTTRDHLVIFFFVPISAFMRRMSPGDGYGRIWKSSPVAVSSAPVFALPRTSRPAAQFPLQREWLTGCNGRESLPGHVRVRRWIHLDEREHRLDCERSFGKVTHRVSVVTEHFTG